MKLVAMGFLAVLAAAPAFADTKDKLCDGLSAVVKSAADKPRFVSLGMDGTSVARPAGMEGALSCESQKGSAGKSDRLLCSWMLGDAKGAVALPERVKACGAVKSWTEAPIVEKPEGLAAHRLVKPDGKVEIVALSTGRIESLTVLVKN